MIFVALDARAGAHRGGGLFFSPKKRARRQNRISNVKSKCSLAFSPAFFFTVSSALGPRHRGHPFCLLGGRRHDLLIAAGRTNFIRGTKRKICFTHKICAGPRHDNSFLTRQPSTCYVMRCSIFGFACLGRAGPPLRRAWAAITKCPAWACAAPGPRLGLGRAWAAPGPRLGNAQPCLRSPRQAQPGRRAGRCLGAALSAAWHCYAAAQRGAVRRTRRRLGGRARALRVHFAYLNTPMLFEYHLNTI